MGSVVCSIIMKRNRASTIFGVFDLLMAALYLFLFLAVIPSRSTMFTAIMMLVVGILVAGGVGMIMQNPLGRKLALASSVIMLLSCFVFVMLLLSSAAYLHGIYDGIGQAGAAIAILAAFLSFQVIGLLPALQLAHLRRLKHLQSSAGTR